MSNGPKLDTALAIQSHYLSPTNAQALVQKLSYDIARLKTKACALRDGNIPIEEYWKDLSEFEEYYGKVLFGSVVEQLDQRAEDKAKLAGWKGSVPMNTARYRDLKTFNEQYQCTFTDPKYEPKVNNVNFSEPRDRPDDEGF